MKMKNTKNVKNIKLKLAKILAVAVITILAFTNCCLATGGIQGTTLVTGTQKLLTDLTNWLMFLAS